MNKAFAMPPSQVEAPIEVVPYDASWPSRLEAERLLLEAVLSPWLVAPLEHIGSTAVPGLPAKTPFIQKVLSAGLAR